MQALRGNCGLASSAQNKIFGRGTELEEDAEGNASVSQPLRENLGRISILLLLRPGAAKPWERVSSGHRVCSEEDVGMRLFQICAVFRFSPASSWVPPHH